MGMIPEESRRAHFSISISLYFPARMMIRQLYNCPGFPFLELPIWNL
jgi:hypothetical protein